MQARHWTDQELVAHLYGVGPGDGHLNDCPACRARIAEMEANRHSFESDSHLDVGFEFLARQRRAIYAGLARQQRSGLPRWASAVAMVSVAAAGFILIGERHQTSQPSISDAQLVEEVSRLAQDPTPSAVAPMEGLFQE